MNIIILYAYIIVHTCVFCVNVLWVDVFMDIVVLIC